MDASAAAYLCIIPYLLFFTEDLLNRINLSPIITVYSIIIIILLSFLAVVDLETYSAWGFRLDATPLQYINNPAEMAASAGASPILLLIFIFTISSIVFAWLYLAYFKRYF